MKLNDCVRGDLVAILWPDGSDYCTGPFGDIALRGSEQLVTYAGPHGGMRKGPKADRHEPDGAYVNIHDWETHQPYQWAFRLIDNAEVLEVVESKHARVEVSVERALGREDDVDDPMTRRMAQLPNQGWGR